MPGGLLLFDNGTRGASRVMQIGVETSSGTAVLVDEWPVPDHGYTPIVGEGNLYGDGVLIASGTDQGVYWVNDDEEVLGSLHVVGAATILSAAPISAFEL